MLSEQLNQIALNTFKIILNIDMVQEKISSRFKLQVRCCRCHNITNPRIKDFLQRPTSKCRCVKPSELQGQKQKINVCPPKKNNTELNTQIPIQQVRQENRIKVCSPKNTEIIITQTTSDCVVDEKYDTNIDITRYIQNGLIKISSKLFIELDKLENKVDIVMSILSRFDKPQLCPIKNNVNLTDLLNDNTCVESNSITANCRGKNFLRPFVDELMAECSRKNKPTYVCVWNDLKLRRQLVERVFKFDHTISNGSFIGAYACIYGRLYNFSPNVAKSLIDHFNAKKILDFCAGFGGRLIGFWTSNAEEYVGIDPNTKIPYDEIIKNCRKFCINKKCNVYYEKAETFDYEKLGQDFDLVFTSPPYYDLEIYANDNSQSIVSFLNYTDWFNGFLVKTIEKSLYCLKQYGILAINIKNIPRYPISDDMLKYLRTTQLVECSHIHIKQPSRHIGTKKEYIYIFQKM